MNVYVWIYKCVIAYVNAYAGVLSPTVHTLPNSHITPSLSHSCISPLSPSYVTHNPPWMLEHMGLQLMCRPEPCLCRPSIYLT